MLPMIPLFTPDILIMLPLVPLNIPPSGGSGAFCARSNKHTTRLYGQASECSLVLVIRVERRRGLPPRRLVPSTLSIHWSEVLRNAPPDSKILRDIQTRRISRMTF